MKYILFIFLSLISFHVLAQNDASFPGVDENAPQPGYDMNMYITKHMHYPRQARDSGVQGKVVVQFVVNENGAISDCHIVKGIGNGCDEEAIRVISHMPRWKKPGERNGKKVKAPYVQVVHFTLTDGK